MTTTHPTLGENRLPRNPLLSEVLGLVSKQKTDISEMHPEMYDLKGNVIPDEIIAFRFENVNFDSEIDDEL